MRVVVGKPGIGVRLVWLIRVFMSVSSMVVLVLYHIILFGEVFHSFVAVVAGGFVGAGLFTSRSLGTSRKMFLKKFKQIFCWPSFDSEGAE